MARILVVDDEAAITTHLEERLTRMGYEVVARASSGESAVETARRLRPDLILMDIVMHGRLDGIEAARVIRKELDIPVVFLTAYGDETFISRAKNVEPLGYVIKPFQESALRAAVEVALYNAGVSKKMRDSEEQWRLLAENMSEGIILADCIGKIFFWNKGAESIFHYRASEAIGQPLHFILPEGQRASLQEKIELATSSGKPAPGGKWEEVVGLRKDWSKFPLEICLTTWVLRGKALFICLVRDISERKRTEDGIKASLREKERLLVDIQEQVQNNLRAIYSLIDLQFEYLKDKKAITMLKENRERIRSISLMHEKLNQDKVLARIDFATYLRNVAHRLFEALSPDPSAIEFKLDLDEVFLDIRTAIPCGLIASELISNSLKYAFPGARKGEVCVEFHRPTGAEIQYSLIVKDDGVGLPKEVDFRKAKSMGFQIVTDLVAQLPGKIKLDRRGGTKFMITFPA